MFLSQGTCHGLCQPTKYVGGKCSRALSDLVPPVRTSRMMANRTLFFLRFDSPLFFQLGRIRSLAEVQDEMWCLAAVVVLVVVSSTIPGSLATACDAAACSGRGSTFGQEDSDGCVCLCVPGFEGTTCENEIAPLACPLHNATNPGGLLPGFEHYTQLGEQGRLWYELEGGMILRFSSCRFWFNVRILCS